MDKSKMKYCKPKEVISPLEFVKSVEPLFDGGPESISIAKIQWVDWQCLGIRWNISKREFKEPKKVSGEKSCVGMPTSRGFPVWFILPTDFFDGKGEIMDVISKFLNNSK